MRWQHIVSATTAMVLAACSAASFDGGTDKAGPPSPEPAPATESLPTDSAPGTDTATSEIDQNGKVEDQNTTDDKSAVKEFRKVPNAEAEGSIVRCETFDSGGVGSATVPANVGCNVLKADYEKLDLTDVNVTWTMKDGQGNDVPVVDAPVPKPLEYHKTYKISHKIVAGGYHPKATIPVAEGEAKVAERNENEFKYSCDVVLLPGDQYSRSCGQFPAGVDPGVNVSASPLGLTVVGANFRVDLTNVDLATGICTSPFRTGTFSQVYAGSDGYAVLEASISPVGSTRFCFKTTIKTNPEVVHYFK